MDDKEKDRIERIANDAAHSLFTRLEAQERRERRNVIFFVIAFVITVLAVTITLVPIIRYDKTPLVKKAEIQNRLTELIKNGAPLDVIKHAYEVRTRQDPPVYSKVNLNDYYSESISLSSILNDLLVSFYSSNESVKDSVYLSNLSFIIQENQYHNPFDNLEDLQSHYFENLRFKIGDEYDVVQDDVIQIATELDHKNQLVSRYLNKSNTSFKISIIALVLTCLLSLFQIYQGHRTNKKIEECCKQQQQSEDTK